MKGKLKRVFEKEKVKEQMNLKSNFENGIVGNPRNFEKGIWKGNSKTKKERTNESWKTNLKSRFEKDILGNPDKLNN